MKISMESAEMAKEDLKDDIVLSKDNRIRGILHLEGITNIKENGYPVFDVWKMKYEDAEIFHFQLSQQKVEFQIKWSCYPPNTCMEDFSTIEIEVGKIWWENIPNLKSPN